jgi:toxin secretion/phage lysis holin
MGMACVFMLLDVVSGFVGALRNRNLNSTKMRDGLFNKCALLIVMFVAWLVEFAMKNVPSLGFDAPILLPVCVIIILMELTSIMENVAKISPALVGSRLLKFFDSDKED